MDYVIYQTDGVVLGKRNFREADSLFFIFTEQFGRVDAVAQGVRYLKSKLRYNLSLFSLARLSLIRTREFWRIVDVEEIIPWSQPEAGPPLAERIASNSEKLILFSHTATLLNRMISGEEKNDFVWKEIKNIAISLTNKELEKKDLVNLEISTALRILDNLGYINKRQYTSRRTAIAAINKAIRESHL